MARPTCTELDDLIIASAWMTEPTNFCSEEEEAVREEAWIAAGIAVCSFFDLACTNDLPYPTPDFSPCPDGSVDVYWRKKPEYLFLLNVDYRDGNLVFDYASKTPTRELSGEDDTHSDGCQDCFEDWLRNVPRS